MLFPCPGSSILPRYMTGSNGLPLAYKTLPPVPSTASSNVHSAWATGLLNANTIGSSLSWPMSCRISFVNVPPTVERPRRAVGRTCSTTERRVRRAGASGSVRERYRLCSGSASPRLLATRPCGVR